MGIACDGSYLVEIVDIRLQIVSNQSILTMSHQIEKRLRRIENFNQMEMPEFVSIMKIKNSLERKNSSRFGVEKRINELDRLCFLKDSI
jgi:hypothetical protein